MGLHAFPFQLTSFVGRARETIELLAQLQEPACRLLTLTGPGGIGKTRLAIQIGTALQAAFADVYFVALQAVDAPEQLPYAIGEAMGIALADNDPAGQLVDALQGAARLLILDNFEQLLDAAALLPDLLNAVPQLKLLVTSREVINLQEEWIYPLEGLDQPDDPAAALDSFAASRLFIERAHRVAPHFDASGQADDIVAICRLVGGTPLAIELAATWARSLTCRAIAKEIQASLHFLTSHQRNIPQRHRSMRAVFDRSWQFLTPAEQTVLRRLAVFQGDFRRDAAEAVAAATLPILTALVDKSLVRVAAQGRYQLHELVRQYALERLEEDAAEATAARRRHAEFYLAIFDQRCEEFISSRHHTVVQEVNTDYENVRVAWYTAIDQLLFDSLRLAADALQYFFDYQARFVECTEFLGAAHAAVAQALTRDLPDPLAAKLALARLGVPYGWALLRLGRLHQAHASVKTSQQIYAELNMDPPPGFGSEPTCALAFITVLQGNYSAALELAQEAHRRLAESNDFDNQRILYYVLGNVYFAIGDYDRAERHYQRAYALIGELGNRWMLGYVVAELGRLAIVRGDFESAQRYYTRCYELKEMCEDKEGMAMALARLARLAMQHGNVAAAVDAYDRSEAIYRRIYDRGGLITALQGQCDVALHQDDLEKAVRALSEALRVVQQTNLLPAALSLLVTSAGLLCQLQDDESCARLLAMVLAHPASDHETRLAAQEKVRSLGLEASALPSVDVPDWDELMQIVSRIEADLSLPLYAPLAAAHTGTAYSHAEPHNQALIEPLTERELEVLALLADGLSNQDIADELIIAIGTVKSYTSHIYGKLAVANRTQAIKRGRELGII